jgi:hypothetical protein
LLKFSFVLLSIPCDILVGDFDLTDFNFFLSKRLISLIIDGFGINLFGNLTDFKLFLSKRLISLKIDGFGINLFGNLTEFKLFLSKRFISLKIDGFCTNLFGEKRLKVGFFEERDLGVYQTDEDLERGDFLRDFLLDLLGLALFNLLTSLS